MLREKKDNLGTKHSDGNVQPESGGQSPATAGWNFEEVAKIWASGGFEAVAQAHNNALASGQVELDGADKVIANYKGWLREAQAALAAEREKVAAAEVTIKEYEDYIKGLDEYAEEQEKLARGRTGTAP